MKYYRVANLPGILEKPGIWQFRQNNLEFKKFWKKPGILTCSVVKFGLTQKIYHTEKKFCLPGLPLGQEKSGNQEKSGKI